MNEIQMIKIEMLEPHPENPRKEVGDVFELAESIKHSGIMQNLTVVAHKERFRVVIGHRRLAAARIAGIDELPCIVSDMDYKEQIATMLSENMQRVDLTLAEQVGGIQMMLDLGEDIESISKKTGFSKSTVNKRAKISALPYEKIKKAEQQGATIEEFLKCLKIKNKKEREALLAKAGTGSFSWEYEKAYREQKIKENMPCIKKEMNEIAKQINSDERWSSKYDEIARENAENWKNSDCFKKYLKKGQDYFWCLAYGTVYLFKKSNKPKKSKKELEANKLRKELEELTYRAFEARRNFISNFTENKKFEKVIKDYILERAVISHFYYTDTNNKIITDAIKKDNSITSKDIAQWLQKDPSALVTAAYFLSGDERSLRPYRSGWGEEKPVYQKSSKLEGVYAFLTSIGYPISDEEEKMLGGTHELFLKGSK